jgi:hypothetical protein
MRGTDTEDVAGVVTVHRKRRNQYRAIDAHGIHRRDHVVARDLRRTGENGGPGAAGVIPFVSVQARNCLILAKKFSIRWRAA